MYIQSFILYDLQIFRVYLIIFFIFFLFCDLRIKHIACYGAVIILFIVFIKFPDFINALKIINFSSTLKKYC